MSLDKSDLQGTSESSIGSDLSQIASGSGTNLENVTISLRCYLKILMHAFRYPHATVNGLLIMEKKKKSKANRLVDCIPLFHSGHGLTPMLEVALNQISEYFHKNTNLVIGGYYQANEFFDMLPPPMPNVFAERISEKIYETNPDSVLLILSDFNLVTTVDERENPHLSLFMYTFVDGKLKLKGNNLRGFQLENSNEIYPAIEKLIFQEKYHLNLVDYDSHLENVKYDWRNIRLNQEIEAFEE